MAPQIEKWWKSLEPLVKRAPELVLVGALILALQWMHAVQLHELRTDFLASIERMQQQVTDVGHRQAEAIAAVAKTIEDHTREQSRQDGHIEALIRELMAMRLAGKEARGG
jgi:hypothetical protein